MKKTYEAPSVEKIAFQYRDQVVVASGHTCIIHWNDESTVTSTCTPNVEQNSQGAN